MGWLNKFQAGGQMAADPKVGRIMQQLTSITQKAAQGDAQAMLQIATIMTDTSSAQLIQMVQQVNPLLYDAMVQISDEMAQEESPAYAKGGKMDYLHMLRCGGKTKKKEDGGEMKEKKPFKLHRISKDAKGGCPCHLKKVGGKIVNVDCEGNILSGKYAGGGAIRKFYDGGTYTGRAMRDFELLQLQNKLITMSMEKDQPYFSQGLMWSAPNIKYLMSTHPAPVGGRRGYDFAYGTYSLLLPPTNGTLTTTSLDTNLTKVPSGSTKNTYDYHKASQAADKQVNANDEIKVWYKRNGYSTDKIRKIQQDLKSLGYNVGELDGKVGPKTIAAIKKFQKDNKLAIDGKIGKQTQTVLNKNLAVGTTPASDIAPYSAVPVSLQPVASNIDEHPEFGIETVIANPNSMYGGYFN